MTLTTGFLGLVFGILAILVGLYFLAFSGFDDGNNDVMIIFGVIMLFSGTAALIGSIFAFIKRIWIFALAGAVFLLIASIPFVVASFKSLGHIEFFFVFTIIPGTVGIFLTMLSKKQYKKVSHD